MTNTFKDVFPETSSCGFREESGSWDIDVGVPDNLSASSLNNYAVTLIRSFLSAFHALCRPVKVEFDTVSFDASGRVKEVKEGQVIQIAEKSYDQVLEKLLLTVGNDGYSYFTDIFVDCNLQVFVPSTKNTLHQVWVPQSAMFYLGYVLEPNEEDILVPIDGSVRLETSIDVWVERTLGSINLQEQDNHACAVQNQPLLEEALKKWEKLVGKPIVEWNSRSYSDQIFKYGFKINQNEMSIDQNNSVIGVGVNQGKITKELAEVVSELQYLREQWSQTYPTHTITPKIGVNEFNEWIKSDPNRKQQTINEAEKQNLAEAAAKIRQLLEELSQTYPTSTTAQKMEVVAKAIDSIKSDPIWKQLAINAVKEEGLVAFEKAIDNPLGAFLAAGIKDWQETEVQ
jgi:hypothetical protein